MPSTDDILRTESDVPRIAVFRALALGDLLCAVPTLRALRRHWPGAEMTLIGLPWAREFARLFDRYLDDFIEFPGWPGLPEREPQLARIPAFLEAMQARQFDLAIQLHGSGTIVNSLVALFGARRTAGFYPPGYFCPEEELFLRWPEKGLEIHRLLSLVRHLGVAETSDELEWPHNPHHQERLQELLGQRIEAIEPFVVVHPGASVLERRWPAENFAAAADFVARSGYQVILTGVASERNIARRVASEMQYRPCDLSGRTDLRTLGDLVARAALVIANDTGISHVAAATKTPSVVISTGSNPARWAPLNRDLHRVHCQPGGVSVAEVCRSIEELLCRWFETQFATA